MFTTVTYKRGSYTPQPYSTGTITSCSWMWTEEVAAGWPSSAARRAGHWAELRPAVRLAAVAAHSSSVSGELLLSTRSATRGGRLYTLSRNASAPPVMAAKTVSPWRAMALLAALCWETCASTPTASLRSASDL